MTRDRNDLVVVCGGGGFIGGHLVARLRQQGQLIPDMDLFIASTALEYELTLLTRNVRHFERVPDLALYQPS